MREVETHSLARVQFAEDFADFVSINLSILLDRVTIADHGAAQHSGLPQDMPLWTVPFTELRGSEDWFELMHNSLSECILGEDENSTGTGASTNSTSNPPAAAVVAMLHTVTYPSRQGGA